MGVDRKREADKTVETLVAVIRIEVWVLLLGLAALVGYQMLTGQINTAGLLRDKGNNLAAQAGEPGTGELSPGRIQLLLLTLFGAASYLSLVAKSVAADENALPAVPEELLLLFGGSHLVYLGGKTRSMLFPDLFSTVGRKP